MSTTRLSLIQRVGSVENEEAWGEFHRVYRTILRAYLGKKAGQYRLCEADIDEIVQNIFIKLIKAMANYVHDPSRGRFRSYLYTVTMNALEDYSRAGRRQRASASLAGKTDTIRDREQETKDWNSEYRRGILNKVLGMVQGEYSRIDPAAWQAYEEQFLKKRKCREVAQELGISEALVYQHSSRINKKIKALCLELYEENLAHAE